MDIVDTSALTIDNLFEPDVSRRTSNELSSDTIIRPNHYQYGIFLEIPNYAVRKGEADIRKVSNAVTRLFTGHPDIEVFSDVIFHTEYVEKPYKRTFEYPFENIPEYIDGNLKIKFNGSFRDAYELCKFFLKLSNAIEHHNFTFTFVKYKENSDEEEWRNRTVDCDFLRYIWKSYVHNVIHINTTGPERPYIKVYDNLNTICEYIFKDKLQTYRQLKRVFDNSEPPLFYENVKRCASELLHKQYYEINELFTTTDLAKLLKTEIDFSDSSKFDTYTISFSVCPLNKKSETLETWPGYSDRVRHIISELTDKTMKGNIDDIRIYQYDETYVLSGRIGTFIDNDYEQTLSCLIISISGQVRRKSCTFAKNLNNIFGDSCRDAINRYITWIHRKR